MPADMISILHRHSQKLLGLKESVERNLRNGYIIEPIPEFDLSFWFRILRFLLHLIRLDLSPPRRKRLLSEVERSRLREKIGELDNILSQIKIEIIQAEQSPELKPVPPWLTDRDDGYPGDWEQISLEYRKKIGFICEDCGEYAPDGHVHHDVPVSRGGSSSVDNLMFLCKDCHKRRHPHMKEC